MKLAIMQPYFLPYVGYFQLMGMVDEFVVYDNIKYTKKGWINRNRMLQNGQDLMFSVPLKNDSDALHVCQREVAECFDRNKLLNQFHGAYQRAPYFEQTFSLLRQVVQCPEINLFRFLHHSIVRTCAHLGIATKITVSSVIDIDHTLKSVDKVLAICEALGASTYVNSIGGVDLYSKDVFRRRGIELQFIQSKSFEYSQFGEEFVPWLSVIDVLMFNPLDDVRTAIAKNYELI